MEEYSLPTRIYSGEDSLTKLEDIKNSRIMLVCDAFLPNSDTLKKIKGHIDSSNKCETFADVVPDPPLDKIMVGVQKFMEFMPTIMIGIGGGSALDTGKGIRFFGEKMAKYKIEKYIAIPTTSGTGSEVTQHAVISDPKNHKKIPLMEDYLRPDCALLDPRLVMTAPKSVTAYSGMDVLTHALESLVAKDANVFTDALAEKVVDVITNNLVECYRHGDNLDARKIVHEASNIAGVAFSNAGLGICHSIAHQVGANFHVPHGLANTMLLPYVIEYNSSNCADALHKYAIAAKKAGIATPSISDRLAVKRLIAKIREMNRQMNCPMSLQAFGVDPKEAVTLTDTIVENAKKDGTFPGNPVTPSDEDLAKVYQAIIR
ncbi:1-propanol dehydrogenase PduQ [Lactobacillus sp. 3B(2020)]|uniref:1-propanol dehydrogenase PduQ n=1 Tax=Lactobacillus sp. 3B(2020) TaxID=2695882 RepID=UPI0015DE230A|nr:1-propanol dehydrogenase PduQ [Lactobacillus sp. 3B(2020)]QLL69157.1 iron-containing alcohol dehydrogenase [Lactobacillus sp. 3B(2020)]